MQQRFSIDIFARILCLVFLLIAGTIARAQEKEYMYEIGASAGLSWVYGDANASHAIHSPKASYSIIGKYNLNLRWAFAAELVGNGIADRHYWQVSFLPEFHFWNYGLNMDYHEKKRYTPFLTAGITGGALTGMGKKDFCWGIPLGAGFKVKVNSRLSAHITALFTKTFSDALDGITDPEGIKTSSLMGNDWLASIRIGFTFGFKERCEECKNQNSW